MFSAEAVVGVVSLSQFTLMLLVENLIVSVVRVVWLSAKAVVEVISLSQFTLMLLVENLVVSVVR